VSGEGRERRGSERGGRGETESSTLSSSRVDRRLKEEGKKKKPGKEDRRRLSFHPALRRVRRKEGEEESTSYHLL